MNGLNWSGLKQSLLALVVSTAALVSPGLDAGAGDVPRGAADFGASPEDFAAGPLVPTSGPSLRERLIREGILEDLARVNPVKLRSRPAVSEEMSAPGDQAAPRLQPTSPASVPADRAPAQTPSDRAPAPVPTVAEKIRHRYSDPRELRLLERLSPATVTSLYIEVAQMIDSRHIQPTSYARRVDAAFEHLELALASPEFRQATRLEASETALARLQESLGQIQARSKVKTLNDAVSVLTRVQSEVDRQVRIHPAAVGLAFVHAELDTLDQFSSLIPPEKTGGPSVGLKDHVVGIGVEVERHEEGLKVLKVLPGGPAADVQMRRGDILTQIDDQPLKGLELNQAVDSILGQPGSSLNLKLLRGTRRGEVTLVRRRITVHAVAHRMVDDENKVGYIKLDSFTDASVGELDKALMALHNAGMTSLILDLRGNPGGLLTAAISISDRFLPEGTIVSTKGRTPSDDSHEVANYPQTWKVPLVVLIDRNSASASEILAAAIQENGRGLILGERSYGKGTVQTLFPLQSASVGLRLTTARFYSPDGRAMAGAGVTPDLNVDPTIGDDDASDAAITAALRVARDPRLKTMAARFIRTGAAPAVFRVTL